MPGQRSGPNPIFTVVLIASFLAPTGGPARAFAGDEETPAQEAARASRMAAEELKRWTIRVGDGRDRPATARPEPVLRYSNPGVGRVYGDVFLFIADGRPEAVMAIYKWFTPWTGFEAEMHSLSTSTLIADRDGRPSWRPDRPGVELKDVPDAPPLSRSTVERMAQMRSIAGGFSARLVQDNRVEGEKDQSLRLLTKPLFRYEAKGPDPKDGALFAFVLGTDPEVFLLLEARDTPAGPRWRYGLARMNSDPIEVSYKGKPAWKVDKGRPRREPQAPYFSIDIPH